MKKIILLTTSVVAFAVTVKAQNVWTGTTIPTTTNGNIGIGTATPASKLEINTIDYSSQGGAVVPGLNIELSHGGFYAPTYNNVFSIYSTRRTFTTVRELVFGVSARRTTINTPVVIGKQLGTAPYNNYALSVDGSIVAKKVVVQTTNWADYVFADDYELKPLEEVETFIKENKHLPDVPSEEKVLAEGADVGEMNRILLQKVEELTLYIIEQDKKLKALELKIEDKK